MANKTGKPIMVIAFQEDDWWVAEYPPLHIASQGKSLKEAVANVKEAVELYIEGEDIKLPEFKTITVTEVSLISEGTDHGKEITSTVRH